MCLSSWRFPRPTLGLEHESIYSSESQTPLPSTHRLQKGKHTHTTQELCASSTPMSTRSPGFCSSACSDSLGLGQGLTPCISSQQCCCCWCTCHSEQQGTRNCNETQAAVLRITEEILTINTSACAPPQTNGSEFLMRGREHGEKVRLKNKWVAPSMDHDDSVQWNEEYNFKTLCL